MNKKCIGRQAYVSYEEIPSVFILQWAMTKYRIDTQSHNNVTALNKILENGLKEMSQT